MTEEEIYRDLKAIKKVPEWKTFVEHINNVAMIHKDSSVQYSTKGNSLDAQRQAWIAEGLIESVEEPGNVVDSYEHSVKGLVHKVCRACGTIMEKVKR
jgi:hypothetical protein